MDEVKAIAKELSRVRALKRNAESSVEFLRSEMEAGRIHLRINPDPSFRKELSRTPRNIYVDPVSGFLSRGKRSWRFILASELFTSEGDIKDEVVIEL